MSILLFLLKSFVLGGIVFFLVLGLINVFLFFIGIPFAKMSRLFEFVYSIIIHFVFIYLYGFFGSYYYKLIAHYNSNHEISNWVLIPLCFIALITWSGAAKKSLLQERSEDDELETRVDMEERLSGGKFNKDLFQKIVTRSGLRTSFFSIISLIVFLIWPNLVEVLYGGIPAYFASLFD